MPLKFQFFDENREEKFPTHQDFNSPSVGILSQRLVRLRKCQIPDLSAPGKSNVAFFSGSQCTIYIQDLYRSFTAPKNGGKNLDDEDDDVAYATADSLGYDATARFDPVLGWGLFSDMECSAIKLLMARISRLPRRYIVVLDRLHRRESP